MGCIIDNGGNNGVMASRSCSAASLEIVGCPAQSALGKGGVAKSIKLYLIG